MDKEFEELMQLDTNISYDDQVEEDDNETSYPLALKYSPQMSR